MFIVILGFWDIQPLAPGHLQEWPTNDWLNLRPMQREGAHLSDTPIILYLGSTYKKKHAVLIFF